MKSAYINYGKYLTNTSLKLYVHTYMHHLRHQAISKLCVLNKTGTHLKSFFKRSQSSEILSIEATFIISFNL